MAPSPFPVEYDEVNDGTDEENDDGSIEHGEETSRDQDTSMVNEECSGGAHTLSNGRQYTFTDEPTNYSLFSNPAGLGLMRQRLFEIQGPVEMSMADFEAYFPFVDNVWRKSRYGEIPNDQNTITETYWCRLRRPAGAISRNPKPTPEGKRSRKKRVKQQLTCGMALKVIRNEGPVRTCTLVRIVPPETRHTHDLDYMDGLKRNSAIMDVARKEALRGFLPASIYSKMWDEEEKMMEAGGKFMKISDVRNVQYQWRQEHPDVVLKAHTGYTVTRSGPRPKVAEAPKPSLEPRRPLEKAPPPPPTQVPRLPQDVLHYPIEARHFLEPYLPNPTASAHDITPYVTLTYASSLDSRISLMPGTPTTISGPETKAMTHYLRSRHDAILIGVRTAIADDPSLNCRLAGVGGFGGVPQADQPRPIIIDPHARLLIRPDMKLLRAVSDGRARGPWIVVAPNAMLHPTAVRILKSHGGEYLMINDFAQQGLGLNWDGLFQILYKEGIRSVMVEGGGVVLSELLKPQYARLVDSVIITIAPTFFGRSGVLVSPDSPPYENHQPLPTRLQNVTWQPIGSEDVVFCGKFRREEPQHAQPNGILQGIEEFSRATSHNGPGPGKAPGPTQHSEDVHQGQASTDSKETRRGSS